MTFDLVIATYNRPNEVVDLVRQVLGINPLPDKIIVVDSSESECSALKVISRVIYVRSSHKNQPYQRLLGVKVAKSELVIFLDDDVKIVNEKIFELIIDAYKDEFIVGATVGIDYHSSIGTYFNTSIFSGSKKWLKWFWMFTGVSFPKEGKISRLGLVGQMPAKMQEVEYFRGPCMSFRVNIIDRIIPCDLLFMYDHGVGKGEDKVISMLALQYGKLIYNSAICLYHPPNSSTYFKDNRSFASKTIFSRLYLSRIYSQVFKTPWWKEVIIYYWFTSWRIAIASFLFFINPAEKRRNKLLGMIDGLWYALTFPQKANRLTQGIDWKKEIQNDLRQCGL